MNRYKIVKEVEKVGRRLEVQFAVVDNLDGKVIVRYAKEKDAQDLIDRYEETIKDK